MVIQGRADVEQGGARGFIKVIWARLATKRYVKRPGEGLLSSSEIIKDDNDDDFHINNFQIN